MITLRKKSLTDFEAAISLPQGDFDLTVTLESIQWIKGDPSVGVKPSFFVDIESVICSNEKIAIDKYDTSEEAEEYRLYNFILTLDWRKAVDAQNLDDDIHDILEDAVYRLEKEITEELEKEF